jgi:hypothetical protein
MTSDPSKTATITVAVAGRRPRERQVHYTHLVDAIERLSTVTTTNKWLKRLVAFKLQQATAYVIVINAETGRD